MKIVWDGTTPITIGQIDDNGKPTKTIVIMPGDAIPEEWLAKMKAAGHVEMIPQDNPLDLAGIERHYKAKWKNQQ